MHTYRVVINVVSLAGDDHLPLYPRLHHTILLGLVLKTTMQDTAV